MSTDTRVRFSFFDLASSAIARSLLTARRLAEAAEVERWETLATRTQVLERAIAEARLLDKPVADALDGAIRQSPILDRVSTAVAGGHRETGRAALEEARALAERGLVRRAAAAYERAEQALDRAIREANDTLGPIEQAAGQEILVQSLRDLGYDDVRLSRSGDLRARRTSDGKVAYASFAVEGGMELGLAGHDGLTCQVHTEEILDALQRNGLEVQDRLTDVHGCEAGGAVARSVEARAQAPATNSTDGRRGRDRLRVRPVPPSRKRVPRKG